MLATSHSFEANARAGLANPTLQRALGMMQSGFPARRRLAVERLPEFEALRDIGKSIKDHTLAHLDFYLELYEENVLSTGGRVHWARDAGEARAAVLEICRSVDAKIVTKGKSMIAEEIGLNEHLEAERHHPGRDRPRRIHHPAAPRAAEPSDRARDPSDEGAGRRHVSRRASTNSTRDRSLAEARQLCDEARAVLRPRFLAADVGITGANFLVAETGSSIIVTNEGNGDLTQTLPRVHIVMAEPRKARADLGRCGDVAAPSGAFGHRPGILVLHDDVDRPAAAGRSRRARTISCRAARQRPQRAAWWRVPRHAPLHSLRGLPEPLPGLRRGRRSRLWLGLFGPDGGGTDAECCSASARPGICRTRRPFAGNARACVRSKFRCRR